MPRKRPDAAAPAAASPESEIAKLRRERVQRIADKAFATVAKKRKASPGGGPSVKSMLDDLGLEPILEGIEAGKFISTIAEGLGIERRTLNRWIDETDERRNAVKTARIEAGHAYALKAQDALLALTSDATQADIAKARELASHFRWMASRMNRAEYGDQQVIELRTSVADLTDEELDREIARKAGILSGALPAGTVLQ
jgi:hypothetical protein